MSNKKSIADIAEWHGATKGIKKLDRSKKVKSSLKPLPKINPSSTRNLENLNSKHSSHTTNLKELKVGDKSGIDYSTLKKIISGNYQIDACLDLHGMTQEQSYMALEEFIKKSYNEHKRLLLIIVGKGKKSENSKGLLRELLPQWINYPTMRSKVINLQYASKQHGGAGAFYILLKRIRNDSNNQTHRASKNNKG